MTSDALRELLKAVSAKNARRVGSDGRPAAQQDSGTRFCQRKSRRRIQELVDRGADLLPNCRRDLGS